MRQKIVMISVPLLLAALFWMQILDWDRMVGWGRHVFYRGKGAVSNIGEAPPSKNTEHARACRQTLAAIQNAKRKAGFDRGNTVGIVSLVEVVHAMYPEEARRGRLTPARLQYLTPVCPGGGTYVLGSMHEMVRCSVMGNGTVPVDDDHIAHN